MSKKHDAVFDDVLSGLGSGEETARESRAGARFLKRSTTIADRLAGDIEEKSLKWVDPAECRMWAGHNRSYDLLTEDNCRDLIDGIRSQGRQEFPAIVRLVSEGPESYEVICGARRHFAIKWLRANNYHQFRYLIDVRDLTDEEAFRLSDIENRDREDISDYERALDYRSALKAYYGGKQAAMASRLEVSEGWLSRYLTLARLPQEVVEAYFTVRDIKELHARQLKPLLVKPTDRERVISTARELAAQQAGAREGRGETIDGARVFASLKAAARAPKRKRQSPGTTYGGKNETDSITVKASGSKVKIEFPEEMPRERLEAAFQAYISDRFGG